MGSKTPNGDMTPAPTGGGSPFEQIRRTNASGGEFWSSREFAQVLGYTDYRNFEQVIQKARLACFNSGQKMEDHFVDVTELIEIGKGGQRAVRTVFLSRYAGYLIVQNADPAKEIVALGQSYFAVQTRRQEIAQLSSEEERRLLLRREMKLHNVKLAGVAKGAGVVTPLDYAIFQNHGYQGLYGGLSAQDIRDRKHLDKGKDILDHMGSTELAANLFRATQTEEKLKRDRVTGKQQAYETHRQVGARVRQTIRELGGTMPENLPAAESIKRVESRKRKALKRKPEEK
jgi:DNA-damage-inducible protein D